MGTLGEAEEEDYYTPMPVQGTHEERIKGFWDEMTEDEVEAVGNLKRLQNKREAHEEQNNRLISQEELEATPWMLEHGAYVWKPKGYPFEGTVVSRFKTLGGARRYVVESRLSPGMLHIFNESQLEAV